MKELLFELDGDHHSVQVYDDILTIDYDLSVRLSDLDGLITLLQQTKEKIEPKDK